MPRSFYCASSIPDLLPNRCQQTVQIGIPRGLVRGAEPRYFEKLECVLDLSLEQSDTRKAELCVLPCRFGAPGLQIDGAPIYEQWPKANS